MQTSQQIFSGAWAVILGGSSGFGAATVEKLAACGMNIAVLYREPSIIEKSIKAKFVKLEELHMVKILPFNINAMEAAGRAQFVGQLFDIDRRKTLRKTLNAFNSQGKT